MVYLTLLGLDRLTKDSQIAEFEVILSFRQYHRMLEEEESAHRRICTSSPAECSGLE
jgi:hypothetical protein